MLRRVVGCARKSEEPWVQYIKRATDKARTFAKDAGVKDWAHEHYRRKWRWAGVVANMSKREWVYIITEWRDAAWQDIVSELGLLRPMRPSRRRWMKFENILRTYTKAAGLNHWREEAANTQQWYECTDRFVAWATRHETTEDIDQDPPEQIQV